MRTPDAYVQLFGADIPKSFLLIAAAVLGLIIGGVICLWNDKP